MNVIIDTNVLLVIIPSKSKYHIAYEFFMDCGYELVCSNEILLEYEEQLKMRYDILSVEEILANLIENKNVQFYDPQFNWNLIQQDSDDNKFVDCAIAANADFIVTNDNHFNI